MSSWIKHPYRADELPLSELDVWVFMAASYFESASTNRLVTDRFGYVSTFMCHQIDELYNAYMITSELRDRMHNKVYGWMSDSPYVKAKRALGWEIGSIPAYDDGSQSGGLDPAERAENAFNRMTACLLFAVGMDPLEDADNVDCVEAR